MSKKCWHGVFFSKWEYSSGTVVSIVLAKKSDVSPLSVCHLIAIGGLRVLGEVSEL